MSDMTVKLNWDGGWRFTGVNAGGIETAIDGDSQFGASPVELLLEALGACVSVDVVSILEKMRTPAAKFEVTLEADRHRTEPRYLTGAIMQFDVWGDGIAHDKLVRAINLSISKYCSVYHSLRDDLKLQPQFRIHATGAEASGDYQLVEMAPPTSELDLS
ncbi:MAG TPA: OsmC family protein [Blastocatellia bacterium]|jgi:putative redox protein|nr:OsmC family protein [Blastocatellia bacterium]